MQGWKFPWAGEPGKGEVMAERPNVPLPQLIGTEPKEFIGQWQLAYQKALKQAEVNYPGDETEQRAVASREANRLFAVDEPETYEQAMAIEPWKCLHRQVFGNVLKVVTIDGKKYSFPIPAEPEKKAVAKGGGKD
jgi:hypothetical protein